VVRRGVETWTSSAGAPAKMVVRLREELLVLCQELCGEAGAVKLKIHFMALGACREGVNLREGRRIRLGPAKPENASGVVSTWFGLHRW
jgi:hypothetical protein